MNDSKTLEFVNKSNEIHNCFYDYSNATYTNMRNKVEIICPLHQSFQTTPASHIYLQSGCPQCGLAKRKAKPKKTTEEFIEKSNVVHSNRYDYSKSIYTGSSNKLTITCKEHGDFTMTANNHLNGSGCPACNNSKGEQEVKLILDKYGIAYIQEFRLDDSLYRYDFFLPDQNILIEFHGIQHYEPVEYWEGEEGFIKQQARDKEKLALAINSQIPLIVLSYYQFNSKVLEASLIRGLKQVYKHWYKFENKLLVFKRTAEAAEYFNLPKTPLSTYFDKLLPSKIKNITLLFD